MEVKPKTKAELFKERLRERIDYLHNAGMVDKALKLTYSWIQWEQAISRYRFTYLRQITHRDIFGHDGPY